MPVTNKSEAFPDSHRGDGIKKIARNTWQYIDSDGSRVVRFHRTDVVREFPDGRVQFNSGGYRSSATKDRFGYTKSPYKVYQNKGVWYVREGVNSIPYYDGIILPDAFKTAETSTTEKDELALFKRINKYCRIIRNMENLPIPNNGDCWYCSMFQAEKPATPNPNSQMGYARDVGQSGPVSDSEHLLNHIDEGYVHGSLLVNAMRWDGMRDAGISMMLHGRAPHDLVAGRVRRYLKRKLGVG